MKHLTALDVAGLVTSEKDGRKRRLYFNAAPIQMIHDRWTTEYSAYWAGQMTRIKYLAEAKTSAQRHLRALLELFDIDVELQWSSSKPTTKLADISEAATHALTGNR